MSGGKAASIPEGQNELKRNQLRELAALNGTLRDDENQACQNCTSTLVIIALAISLPPILLIRWFVQVVKSVIGNTIVQSRGILLRTSSVEFVVTPDTWRGIAPTVKEVRIGVMMTVGGLLDPVDPEPPVWDKGTLSIESTRRVTLQRHSRLRLTSLTNNSNLCKNSLVGPLLLLLVLPVLKVVSKLGREIPTEVMAVATVMVEVATAARIRTKNRDQMVVLSNLGSVVLPVGLHHGRWVVAVVAAAAVVDVVAMVPLRDMRLPMLPQGRVACHLGNNSKATALPQDRLVVRLHRGEHLRSTASHLHLQALQPPHGLLVRLGLPLE